MTALQQEPSAAVAEWNAAHPVGTPVRYWTGLRKGDGVASVTRTEAQLLGGHTPVVWVEGEGACIALTHVEPKPVVLSGAAVLDRGTWFASPLMDAPMVKAYRDTVKVYGNRRDWFMRPDTARSMATALEHYATRAEAFHEQ